MTAAYAPQCATCGDTGLAGPNELAPPVALTLCPDCQGQYAAARVAGQRAVQGQVTGWSTA